MEGLAARYERAGVNKKTAIAAGLTLLLAAGGGYWYYQYRNSPEYALSQIRDAVQERNALKFERYVALEPFSEALVDDVFSFTLQSTLEESSGGLEALGSAIGANLLDQLKPTAASLVQSSIRESIETGKADSIFESASAKQGDVQLSKLLQSAAVDPSGFKGLGDIQREDDVAIVGLRFRNAPLDTTVTFKVKLETRDGRWTVTQPYDLPRLLRAVDDRQERLIADANEKIRSRLRGMVDLGDVDVTYRQPCLYCDERLVVDVPITNASQDTFDLVQVALTWLGEPLDEEARVGARDIPPGETSRGRKEIDYNQFIDWHSTLRRGNVDARTEFVMINFGEMISEIDDWDGYVSYWRDRREQTDGRDTVGQDSAVGG